MFRKPNQIRILCAVIVLVSLAAGIATAATVTPSITYQGKLTNAAGSPLTGTYSVTFKLYDVASGGTALVTDTHSVTATNGLFTTTVAANPQLPDGRALWLGIKVGSDPEMTPRQEIRPVPYALGIRPGAVINVTGLQMALYLLKYDDTYGGLYVDTYGKYNAGVRSITHGRSSTAFSAETLDVSDTGYQAVIRYADSDGVSVRTESGASTGYRATIQGDNSAGVSVNSSGFHSPGVDVSTSNDASYGVYAITKGTESDAVRAYTLGENSAALYGNSAQDVGVYGTGKAGGVYGESQTQYGVKGSSSSTVGIYGSSISDAGVGGSGKYGVYGWGNGSTGIGVVGDNGANIGVEGDSQSNVGVKGWSGGDGSKAKGVYGTSTGWGGTGVFGESLSSGHGVYGISTSGDGVKGVSSQKAGVNGTSISGYGVYGIGKEGGYFTTNQESGSGVNISTANYFSEGLRINTAGVSSTGVHIATNAADSHGVEAQTSGTGSKGIFGYSDKNIAIEGETGQPDGKWGFFTYDYIYARGTQYPAIDVAEFFPVAEESRPGTVMSIGTDGTLQPSTTAYDTRVAGIVSTDPAVSLGAKDTGNPGEAAIAVAGRVPCKVDAGYGAIHAGDLLTSSDTIGYAKKAEPTMINGRGFYPDGTILGKAMGSLESGTGTIEVLVTLQ